MISLTIILCVVAAVWLTIAAATVAIIAADTDYHERGDAQYRAAARKVIALLTVAAVLVSVPFVIVLQAVAK